MPNQETLSNRPGRQKIRFGQNLDGPESEKQSGGEETLGTGIRRGRRVVRRRVMRLGEEYLTVDKKEKKEKTVSRGQEAKEKGGVAGLRKPRFKLGTSRAPQTQIRNKRFSTLHWFFS